MRDVCFNRELIYFVAQGGAPAVWADETAARVARVASMYRCDGERLWLLGKRYPGFEHIAPPICVDLITGMDDPAGPGGETTIIVSVCAFSKWVEVGYKVLLR